MNKVKTYLDSSQIEGIGVFTDEFIPKGSIVWEYDFNFDIKFSINEYTQFLKSNPDIYRHFDKYVMKKDDIVIYCVDNAKFVNHSNSANTFSTTFKQIAIVDILKGEEITCNYFEIDDEFSGF